MSNNPMARTQMNFSATASSYKFFVIHPCHHSQVCKLCNTDIDNTYTVENVIFDIPWAVGDTVMACL